MNHVPSNALTRPILPDIAPLPVGLFSTSVGLYWYHESIALVLVTLFNTSTGLLTLTRIPCLKLLLSMDPLPVSLFSTPVGFLRIKVFFSHVKASWYLERAKPTKHIIQIYKCESYK